MQATKDGAKQASSGAPLARSLEAWIEWALLLRICHMADFPEPRRAPLRTERALVDLEPEDVVVLIGGVAFLASAAASLFRTASCRAAKKCTV